MMKWKSPLLGLILGLLAGFFIEKVLNSCSNFECWEIVPPIWTTLAVGVFGLIIGLIINSLNKGKKSSRKR